MQPNQETTTKIIVEHHTITEERLNDSLEIGTPSKGGVIKIYGNSANKEDFKRRIDDMIELRKHLAEKAGNPQ